MIYYIGKLKTLNEKEETIKFGERKWDIITKKSLYIVREWESINLSVPKDFSLEKENLKLWEEYLFPVNVYNNYWISSKSWKAYSIINYWLNKHEEIKSL